MDFYQKKYLKYKNKYLSLLNQQGRGSYTIEQKGGRHTSDLLNMTKKDILLDDNNQVIKDQISGDPIIKDFIFDYDADQFIKDPIGFTNIPVRRAILINNTIYDYLQLYQAIILQDVARDPITRQIINPDDLELMYSIAKKINQGFLFDDNDKFKQLQDRTRIQYNIQKDKIIDSIKSLPIINSQTYFSNKSRTSLNIIDLNELKDLLENKKIILNSLDSKIKDDILSKPFDCMFQILLLTEEEIKKLYSYDSNIYNYNKILNLTINQKKKILSYNNIKQQSILNFNNNDKIDFILSIKDISIQDNFLEYDSDIQEYIFSICYFGYEFINKLLKLSQDELKLLINKFTTNEDIVEIYNLSLDEIKQKLQTI
jgi:hypothetical protein